MTIASVTTIASQANSSRRPTFASVDPTPRRPMRRAGSRSPLSGRIADAISAIVRRVRNLKREPSARSAADDPGGGPPRLVSRVVEHRRQPPPPASGRTRPRRRRRRHEPVADAADRLQVDRPVRVDLDLLAEPAHRDPDVRRVGVLGVGPAADEQRVGRDGLAEVRGEGVEQPRFGRRQLDHRAADGRLAPMQVEGQVRARGSGSGAGPCRRGGAGSG